MGGEGEPEERMKILSGGRQRRGEMTALFWTGRGEKEIITRKEEWEK